MSPQPDWTERDRYAADGDVEALHAQLTAVRADLAAQQELTARWRVRAEALELGMANQQDAAEEDTAKAVADLRARLQPLVAKIDAWLESPIAYVPNSLQFLREVRDTVQQLLNGTGGRE